jgi:predicted ester cyclase
MDTLVHASTPRPLVDEEPSVAEMERLAFGYADAKNRLQAREAMSFCTDDFVFEVPPFPTVYVAGKEQVVAYLDALWSSFPDLYTAVDSHVAGPGGLVAVGRMRGTMRGPFLGFEPTRRSFDVSIVSVCTFERGAMRCERNYVDTFGLLVQIGVPADAVVAATK